MSHGVEVEITDDLARVSFPDPASRAAVLGRLVELAGPDGVKVDTGGLRRAYLVPRSVAEVAELIDKPRRRGRKSDTE